MELTDGRVVGFVISQTAHYAKEELPFDRIFTQDGDPVLVLISCGGYCNRYFDNLVAYAIPTF